MTEPAVATDVHQSLDIHLHTLSEVTLDVSLRVDDRSDLVELVFAEIADFRIERDVGRFENLRRSGSADTIDIGQANLNSFVWWKVYSCYTRHNYSEIELLTLPLFVLGVLTNDAHHTFAVNDFALVTNLFD
jgi:hypothetical protein